MIRFHLAEDVWLRRLFFALALLYVLPFWTDFASPEGGILLAQVVRPGKAWEE